jgi:hypothetical protein
MKSIKAVVVRHNTVEYPTGLGASIPADNTAVEGTYWRIPVVSGGVFSKYIYRADAGTKPTPDSVKVVRVRNIISNDTWWVVVPDNGSYATFADLIGVCCDDSTTMPAVTIPDVIVEEQGCADDDGNYHYSAVTSALGSGEVYVGSATLNGAALTALSAVGYASLAAFETAAEAAWTPATITIDGNKVTLNTATGTTGSLYVGKRKYFESNAPGALTSGQHYTLAATINGVALANIVGVADAALSTIATAANANAAYAAFGVWSVTGGKVRLVSNSGAVQSATLVVTIS